MISFNNIEITEPIGLNGSVSLYYHRLNILMEKVVVEKRHYYTG